jgi:uncharacterized phage-associated protein
MFMSAIPFDEAKATQAAASFLKLRGEKMSYMKLLKLLYMADRTALLRWGKPVTTDRWVAMKHGPVLSNVLNLITDEQTARNSGVWARYISAPRNYEVELLTENVPNDRLSVAEERLIGEMYESYGHLNRWDLVDHLHKILPEWTNPGDSSVPIQLRDILGIDRDESEVREIEAELKTFAREQALLSFA